jgi:serine phosphatase RsbU (regulator of sigma subunit)/tetratricopeptide (TPR) repeat protein
MNRIFSTLLVAFYFCFSTINAQYKEIDSLKTLVSKNINDTTKAQAYYELTEIYGDFDLDTMLIFCIKSIELADKNLANEIGNKEKKSFLKTKASAINNVGFYYRQKGAIAIALDNFHKSLAIRTSINDKKGIAESYSNLGYIYNNSGEINKALDSHLSSLRLREEIGDLKGQSTSLNRIANIYLSVAEKLRKENGSKETVEYKINQALSSHNRSLAIREKLGLKLLVSESLNSIGLIYLSNAKQFISENKSFEKINVELLKAEDYFRKSLEIRNATNDKKGVAETLTNLAQLSILKNDFGLAKKYALQSLEIAEKIGYPEIIKNAAFTLKEIYENNGDVPNSYKIFKLFVLMRDSIQNSEIIQKEFEMEFQRKIENDSLNVIKKEKTLANEQLKQEQTYRIFLLLGVIFIAIFGAVVFNRYRISLKQNKLINLQRQAVEHQRNQIARKNQEILSSINYAKRIQATILPSEYKINKNIPDSFVLYIPKDIVSGDFYWVESNKEDKNLVFFAAADCTGHGVPGAMVSVVCHTALNKAIKEDGCKTAAEILNNTTDSVIYRLSKNNQENDVIKDGMDISLCALDKENNQLSWAGANNPLWVFKNNGEFIEIKGNKQPVGFVENKTAFTNHLIKLEKGDVIYLFTDGYLDQFGGERGKKLMKNSFKELLLSIHKKPMEDQKTELLNFFNEYKGFEEQVDDVCVIGVRV